MSARLVLLPGSLCDDRLFAEMARFLATAQPDWVVDIADLSQDTSIESMAESVLDSQIGDFAVVGLSLGGIVAAEIFHQAPERVTGVGLLDTNLAMPDGQQLSTRARWAELTRCDQFLDMVRSDLIAPMTVDQRAHGALIYDMASSLGAETFLRQNEALLHRRDRRDDLASITVPTVVACGSDDGLCPPHLHRDLSRRIPGSKFVVVEGAGHLSTIDQPEALSQVLAGWLDRCADNINNIQRGRTQ